jgi:acyl carrier protein
MLKQLILDYLRQQPDVPVDKLADPTAKMGEFGLDSLGLVEMLFEIEDKYGFQIEEPMRYGSMTLDEVVADLEQTIRARNNGEMPELPAQAGPAGHA